MAITLGFVESARRVEAVNAATVVATRDVSPSTKVLLNVWPRLPACVNTGKRDRRATRRPNHVAPPLPELSRKWLTSAKGQPTWLGPGAAAVITITDSRRRGPIPGVRGESARLSALRRGASVNALRRHVLASARFW